MADHGMATSNFPDIYDGRFFFWFDLPLGGSALAEEVPTWGRCRKSICWWASTVGWKGGGCLMSPTLRGLGLMSASWPWLAHLAQWLDGPTRGLRILTIHETSFYGWRSLKSQCSETVLTAIWSTPRKIDMIHLKITQLEFGESSEPNFVISSR